MTFYSGVKKMAASMGDDVEGFVSGLTDEAPKKLATDINRNGTKFVQFIEQLGVYLTSPDNVARGRATQLIGEVLDLLPPSFLSDDQVKLVVTFLLTKLSDHHSVQPHALHSLAVLTNRCSPLPSGLPEDISRTIFREVQNQTLAQSHRRATYMILENILRHSSIAVKDMGGDFVIGFIQQMDAEKDPRNLMICFNCAHFVSTNLHLGAFTEEMFEVLACYFPIDFAPPPTDPHGITKEELVISLRKCLASNQDFAEFCLPLLLEKMNSDLQAARMDALLTLTEAALVYGNTGLTPFLGSITSSIKREVLMNVSTDLVNAAKQAVTAVYSALGPKQDVDNSKDTSVTMPVTELYQDISKYLEGTDVAKSCLAYSLCQSIALSSPQALCTIASLVLPSLINCCSKQAEDSEQLHYLKELKGFLDVFNKFSGNPKVTETLSNHLSQLFNLYEGLLQANNTEIQLQSIQAFTLLTSPHLCPSEDKRDHLIGALMSKSLTATDAVLRKQVLSSLSDIMKANPIQSLKTVESFTQQVDSSDFQLVLEAMVHSVVEKEAFLKANDFLLHTISKDLTANQMPHILTCADALSTLLTLMSGHSACVELVVEKTALPLLRIAVASISHWTEETKDKCRAFMSCCRDMFQIVGCSISKSDVTDFWDKLQKLMLEGDTKCIDLPGDSMTLKPLKSESPWQQTSLVALLEGFVVAGNIQAMIEQREVVFESTYGLALGSEDDFTHVSACRCTAAILNKAPIGSEIHWLLEPIVEKTKSVMAKEGPLPPRLRAVMLWGWLTKAMECRGHSATAILSSHLVSLLGDSDLGSQAAESLGLVVQDMEDIFTAKLKGNITPLYKQRFFTLNLPALLKGYHTAQTKNIKDNHLMAISSITANLPLQVVKPHLAKLVPLLLMSLSQLTTNASLSHTLATLSSAVVNAPDVVGPNVDSLIPRLLDLARKNSAMKVRLAALKSLEELTCLPTHTVVPHQKKVVHELAFTLDDKKRLVRKQAVETRCAWILLEKMNK